MSDIQAEFDRAKVVMANPPSTVTLSNEARLKLYSLFKQAEVGPCTGSRPGFFDFVGQAKYDAWKALGDKPKEQAMQEYVAFAKELLGGEIPAEGSS